MDFSFAHRVEMEAQHKMIFFLSDTAGDTDIIFTPNKNPEKKKKKQKYMSIYHQIQEQSKEN